MFSSNDPNIIQSKTLSRPNNIHSAGYASRPIESNCATPEKSIQNFKDCNVWSNLNTTTETQKSVDLNNLSPYEPKTTANKPINTMVSSHIFTGSEQEHQTEFIDFSYLLDDFNTLTGACNDQVASSESAAQSNMPQENVLWDNYVPFEPFDCSDVKTLHNQNNSQPQLTSPTNVAPFESNIGFPCFDASLLSIKTEPKYSNTSHENFSSNSSNFSSSAIPVPTTEAIFLKSPMEPIPESSLPKIPSPLKTEIMVSSPPKITVAKDNSIPKKLSPIEVSKCTPSGSSRKASSKERPLHYCPMCPKGFKDKYSVNVHLRTHTGEKPYCCTVCGKNFRQKAHLGKHFQTHSRTIDPFLRKPAKRKHETLEKESMYYNTNQDQPNYDLPTYPYPNEIPYNFGMTPIAGNFVTTQNNFGLSNEQFPNR